MKSKPLTILFLIAAALGGKLNAQNYPIYNSYFLNPYLYNPAEAATDRLQVFAGHRRQWVGINGAPRISALTASTLLNNTRVGVGLKVSSFKRGFLETTDASLTYSYGVPLNKTSRLFFGLSGGLLAEGIDWSQFSDTDLSDDGLKNLNNTIIPAASFGMLYRNASGFNFGVALPRMIGTESIGSDFSVSPFDNIIVSAYYRKEPPKKGHTHHAAVRKKKGRNNSKYVPVEVYSLYRYSNLGGQFELSGKLNLSTSFWLSATYRQSAGFVPGLGLNMGNLSLNYFYEFGSNSDLPLKTHEAMVSLRIGGENKFREKVPPIIAKRPATQTVTKTTPPVTQPKTETKPVETQPVVEQPKQETVTQTQEPVIEKTEPVRDTVASDPRHRARLDTSIDTLAVAHAEERKQLEEHIDEHKDGTHDDEHSHPVNQRHEFVKRGTHHEELEEGTYVIAGAFASRSNAEHYVKTLISLGFQSDFGHLTAKNLWYVYIANEPEVEEAKKDRDSLQKNKMFKDVWLMTVHQ